MAPRVAIVTGATRGLGRAIALRLAADGYAVGAFARSAVGVREMAAHLRVQRVPGIALRCDVTSERDIERALQRAERDLGPPSVLVNNAGLGGPLHRSDEVSADEWKTLFTTNVSSAFALCRRVLPGMSQRRSGRIVNVASIYGLVGGARSSTYAATKHALIGYTRSLAAEWGHRAITVNALCPGFVEHAGKWQRLEHAPSERSLLRRIPAGRFGRADEIAAAVAFLVGPDAAYINGATIVIDGGLTSALSFS